jgi:hypothetical protein
MKDIHEARYTRHWYLTSLTEPPRTTDAKVDLLRSLMASDTDCVSLFSIESVKRVNKYAHFFQLPLARARTPVPCSV